MAWHPSAKQRRSANAESRRMRAGAAR
jgi:hypothetical protein